MWDETRAAHYAIWLVAFALYAYDSARLISARELLLVEAARGRLTPGLSDNPFNLAGRALLFAPLLKPYRAAFVAPWGRPWIGDDALEAAIAAIGRLRSSLGVVRIVASAAFVLLFLIGPALTWWLGPDAGLLATAAAVYPTAVVAMATLWWRRRRLGLTSLRCLLLGAEIIVCPAFLPNLVRKIAALHSIEIDGSQILAATSELEVKTEFFARLEARIEDEPAAEELQDYLTKLRTAK